MCGLHQQMTQLIPFGEMMSAETFACANLLMLKGVTGKSCHIWQGATKKKAYFLTS